MIGLIVDKLLDRRLGQRLSQRVADARRREARRRGDRCQHLGLVDMSDDLEYPSAAVAAGWRWKLCNDCKRLWLAPSAEWRPAAGPSRIR